VSKQTSELNTLRWRLPDLVEMIIRWRNQDRARLTALEAALAELRCELADVRWNAADGIADAVSKAKEADIE
jgi:hypothetical protein